MDLEDNYKIISICDDSYQKHIKKSFYLDINSFFLKSDIKIEETDDGFEIFLNSLDILEYESFSKSFINNYSNEIERSIILRIIEEINKIKSYGIKSGKKNYVDYNKERKVQNRKEKVIKRQIHYYANDNDFSKINNEFPHDYLNKIICGDSEEVLKNLPDNCVDLIFTSPPYNFGLDYDNHEDGTLWDEYFEKLFSIFSESVRVLKFGGRIIINVQPLFSDYIPIHHIISNFFMNKKLIWKGEILWEKNNYNCKYTAWGSWKSPSSPYLKYTWEFLEIFCKGELVKKGDSSKIDITSDEFKSWVVAKWSIAPERNMKKYDHPAMFPEELVNRVLKLFSYENDIILDPFSGVGTTCAVSKRNKRNYIGIDSSIEYCKKAENRINEISILNKFF